MAAERYYIKQGDWGQTITATCKDAAGTAVDISAAAAAVQSLFCQVA